MVNIKTPEQLSAMREGGQILAKILHDLAISVRVGMKTEELDLMAETMMADNNVVPSFKHYRGYPSVLCTSVNEEVVHSIPSKRTLNDGDILSIDCGIIHKGMHSDSAVTVLIGNVTSEIRLFAETVQESLEKAIKVIRPGIRTGDIGYEIQHHIEQKGYSVVKDFIGHGIGKNLHEPPEVPNFGKKGKGQLLLPGMTIAIEPIIAKGARYIDTKKDGWTAVTRDGSVACQIEHTVAILTTGCEVLTQYDHNINNLYPQ